MTGDRPTDGHAVPTPSLRLLISTGEVSGDLQGSLLIQALYRQAQARQISLQIFALGGDRMAAAGATMIGNTSSIASVGLLEAIPYVLPTLRLQHKVRSLIQHHPLDGIVLIDYFGSNIGVGQFVRRYAPSIPITYYIAPQEWVWSLSPQNTQRIVKVCDRLLAIFPLEATYYQQHGAQVSWVGHPLLDWVTTAPTRTQARDALHLHPDDVAIALLPASRWQEIRLLLPIMIQAAQQIQAQIPQAQFWIPLSLDIYRPAIEAMLQRANLKATIVSQNSQTVLAAADLAIAKSGTVNLELALMNVPQVVLYRVGRLTAWIAKSLLKFSIPFMSPPNLVLMEPIVPEFLQDAATPEAIAQSSLNLLLNPAERERMQANYQRMRQALGEPGVCDRAAQQILDLVQYDRSTQVQASQ